MRGNAVGENGTPGEHNNVGLRWQPDMMLPENPKESYYFLQHAHQRDYVKSNLQNAKEIFQCEIICLAHETIFQSSVTSLDGEGSLAAIGSSFQNSYFLLAI